MKNKQIKKTEQFTLTHNQETGAISLNGKVVTHWDNEATIHYPEDLTFDRDISTLVREAIQTGYDLALEEMKEGSVR